MPMFSSNGVKVLGSVTEPNEVTARAALDNCLTEERFRAVTEQFGIRFGARIGGGYYSNVFKVKMDKWKGKGKGNSTQALKEQGHKKWLIKIVNAARCPKESNYHNELAICKLLQNNPHPHLCTIVRHFEWPGDQYWLVMPNSGYPLSEFLAKCTIPKGRVPESVGRSLFSQLLKALSYLHRNNVVHRDIKPENVLVTRVQLPTSCLALPRYKYSIKLIDFGFAKIVPHRSNSSGPALCLSHKGTLEYMAPELLVNCLYYDAIKSDIYSTGVLLYYMLHGNGPFMVPKKKTLSEANITGNDAFTADRSFFSMLDTYYKLKLQPIHFAEQSSYEDFAESTNEGQVGDGCGLAMISPPAQSVIRSILQAKPEERPTLDEIKQHQWMTMGRKLVKKGHNQYERVIYPSTDSF